MSLWTTALRTLRALRTQISIRTRYPMSWSPIWPHPCHAISSSILHSLHTHLVFHFAEKQPRRRWSVVSSQSLQSLLWSPLQSSRSSLLLQKFDHFWNSEYSQSPRNLKITDTCRFSHHQLCSERNNICTCRWRCNYLCTLGACC